MRHKNFRVLSDNESTVDFEGDVPGGFIASCDKCGSNQVDSGEHNKKVKCIGCNRELFFPDNASW